MTAMFTYLDSIVRKDCRLNERKRGVVRIYLRTNINYQIRDDLINDDLEYLIVEISKPQSSALLVSPGSDLQTLRLNVYMNLRM